MKDKQKIIDYIMAVGNNSKTPAFRKQCFALEACYFERKPFWFPFKRFNTVINRTIYLSDGFYSLEERDKAAVFVHEATHLLQWKRNSSIEYSAGYLLQKEARWRYEKEAYGQEIKYFFLDGRIHRPQTSHFPNEYGNHPVIGRIKHDLMTGYFFGDFLNDIIVWSFLEGAVQEAWKDAK